MIDRTGLESLWQRMSFFQNILVKYDVELQGKEISAVSGSQASVDLAKQLAKEWGSMVVLGSAITSQSGITIPLSDKMVEDLQNLHIETAREAVEQELEFASIVWEEVEGPQWIESIEETEASLVIVDAPSLSIPAYQDGSRLLTDQTLSAVWIVKPESFQKSPSTILLAIDSGLAVEIMLELTIAIAKITDSRIQILHLVRGLPDELSVSDLEQMLSERDGRTVAGGIQIVQKNGDVEETVIETVQETNPDLLIYVRDEPQEQETITGEISRSLIQKIADLPCSVMVVPETVLFEEEDEFEESDEFADEEFEDEEFEGEEK